jgi:hypothetical protein
MMILKLDATTLKHLNYHWLWGLRSNEIPQPVNLSSSVEALLGNKHLLTDRIRSQQTLNQHHAVFRFFYWLFNVNNYTYHAYLLAACKAHQQYLQALLPNASPQQTPWDDMKVDLAYASEKIARLSKSVTSQPRVHFDEQFKDNHPLGIEETAQEIHKAAQETHEAAQEIHEAAQEIHEAAQEIHEEAQQDHEVLQQAREATRRAQQAERAVHETAHRLEHQLSVVTQRLDSLLQGNDPGPSATGIFSQRRPQPDSTPYMPPKPR